MTLPTFPLETTSTAQVALRAEVRAFLSDALVDLPARERARSWVGFDADFSAELGKRGWLGMTLPKAYGGHGRDAVDRHIVVEELLAAGAPVAAHWIADRQSAPLILRHGTEDQRRTILPRIAAGTCFFGIGMSEASSGSDLASVRTKAERTADGFVLNGTKLWTTYGHKAHYMIVFCRTGKSEDRHGGFSQVLVDMSLPGITVSPVLDIAGEHHFNEVSFDNVVLPPDALLGEEGGGWAQVMSELAFERSGPDRFLSSYVLVEDLLRCLKRASAGGETTDLGRMIARLMVLRQMSLSVAGRLARGEQPVLAAAIVKDLGALFEQDVPEIARRVLRDDAADAEYAAVFQRILLAAPSFSLRGGTREILRGIIARGLGLR
ncbi:acyl-CoA dehydrogenase [Salipiger aestuarii]|uniref:Alkylation response protein AidB-like acyl-CoA dehydrogenase n=1 Tax=Salipiger aestuarii TaxID=568098 RepID=A0A327XZ38_9RHOB|nr:acyl-CoA dehydrogenase family protein [Salipiger aestuarii]KAA8606726.1 acyl-CoA dehydrogenase [Salipiger aestuarii]KAA8610592.1 acyl-CoA dehydrogenase [Salipiger aestuarii]KAB2541342.1 acyl-CoA dehydrogenase [Salipiger aestuarii]RAK13993.1 alkylation response protein AidB-like acyl-CoA dehydrogenase [Salipiger aestuarii]